MEVIQGKKIKGPFEGPRLSFLLSLIGFKRVIL